MEQSVQISGISRKAAKISIDYGNWEGNIAEAGKIHFAASVVLVPELIYTGEKAEIKCTPANNHFVVTSDIIK